MTKKRVLIYGCGENCVAFLKNAILDELEIVGIVDKYRYGDCVCGIKIGHIDEITQYDYEKVFVTPKDNSEIIEMLLSVYSVRREDIILPGELNGKYILPRVFGYKNVFITTVREDNFFSYVFRGLSANYSFLTLRIMEQNDTTTIAEKSNEPIVFIILSDDLIRMIRNGIYNELKKNYTKSQYMLWMCNPCDDMEYGIPTLIGQFGGVQRLKSEFDVIYTYHSGDAERYGFLYYSQFYPQYQLEACDNEIIDVFFVGNVKNRYRLICDVFKKLVENGIRCKFILFGVAKENQINECGLIYVDKYVGYDEIVKDILSSKCILEICDGYNRTSFRYAEAVVYGKKLLINDESVVDKRYYSDKNMQVFKDPNDINAEWIKKPVGNYCYEGDFEPEYVLGKVIKILL